MSTNQIPQNIIPQGTKYTDMGLRKEFNNIYRLLSPLVNLQATILAGVSGTFKSSDTPAKTITVKNGIVTEIK